MEIFKKKILSKDELRTLAGIVADAEKGTSGEIRVVLREKRQWNEMNLSLRDLTLKEFYRLGMQKTRDKTGVIILLLLSEKKLYIAADEAIDRKVADGTWSQIADRMSVRFKESRFFEGLAEAVRDVGTHLNLHFPRKSDDTNELPNEVVQR